MNTELETKLRRIEKTSSLLRGACTGFFVLIAISTSTAVIAAFAGRMTEVKGFGRPVAILHPTSGTRVLIAACCLVTGLVLAKCVFHLRRLLDNYTRREIFTAGSARQIRQFGLSCILWGLVKACWAFVPALTSDAAPQPVDVTLDAVLIGAAIVAISWFAEMAAGLREENDLTI